MHSKQFLTLGGAVLVLVAVLGYLGIIGPTADKSIFGAFWWFDNGENLAHLVLGVVALIAAFALPGKLQKPLVQLVGALALFFAAYNVFSTSFLGSNLESPADLILHLGVGIWALWSARGPVAGGAAPMAMSTPAAPAAPSSPSMPAM